MRTKTLLTLTLMTMLSWSGTALAQEPPTEGEEAPPAEPPRCARRLHQPRGSHRPRRRHQPRSSHRPRGRRQERMAARAPLHRKRTNPRSTPARCRCRRSASWDCAEAGISSPSRARRSRLAMTSCARTTRAPSGRRSTRSPRSTARCSSTSTFATATRCSLARWASIWSS